MTIAATTQSYIKTTADLKAEKLNNPINDQMGQREFLLLFTTQLQNQNPLDPMQNEAFVAQLAQFSQLEATTTMGDKLSTLVDSLKGDRMLQGASLLGKKVAVPNGPAYLEQGAAISGVISIPNGADKVELNVYSMNGQLVKTEQLGRRMPGEVTVRWDGTNAKGDKMPDGQYRVVATVNSFGTVTQVPISTPDVVRGVTYSPEANDLMLEVASGLTVPLSQVTQIKN
ncbi:MAG: Basal-body rod modification protein FlgD [Pseudomonadota bacterium]|jgi:flagellar basal-body rod modification protein FlgD